MAVKPMAGSTVEGDDPAMIASTFCPSTQRRHLLGELDLVGATGTELVYRCPGCGGLVALRASADAIHAAPQEKAGVCLTR
jgi:hypothetical protein